MPSRSLSDNKQRIPTLRIAYQFLIKTKNAVTHNLVDF